MDITKTEIKQTIAQWDKKLKLNKDNDGFGKYHIENNEIVFDGKELKIRNLFLNDEGELLLPFKASHGEVIISASKLKSFKNFPRKIIDNPFAWAFYAQPLLSQSYIDSLEGFPEDIEGNVDLSNDRFKSINFHNVHKYCKRITGTIQINEDYKGPLLGFLMVNDLRSIICRFTLEKKNVFDIINRHLDLDRDILECREELVQAGLKEYAKI